MTDTKILNSHSNGWGIQSVCILALQISGDLPRSDISIFADTGYERAETYSYIEKWTPYFRSGGLNLVTVERTGRSIYHPKSVMIPAFTLTVNNNQLKKGMLRRQCTKEWKIRPIRRYYRMMMRSQGYKKIIQAISISSDEALRVSSSDVKYISHQYPLIDLGLSRSDCMRILEDRMIELPLRSSCIFCPYHDPGEWRSIRNNREDNNRAIAIDEYLRDKREPGKLYIHPSAIPFVDVDLRNHKDRGQLSLWDDECSGICGV